jgi:hypothetical protein
MPQPGNVITVTLTGDPGATATFDIAGIAVNIPMTETSQGMYSGNFRIPDTTGNIRNASIIGRLSRNGRETLRPAQSAGPRQSPCDSQSVKDFAKGLVISKKLLYNG